jgi:defect-in-organelle-trafficking protein DotC
VSKVSSPITTCLLSLLLTLGGCGAFTVQEDTPSEDLGALLNLSNSGATSKNIKGKMVATREMSLKEIALSAGAQAGLAAQAKQFNDLLDKSSAELDAIFNFNALLLNNGVLPPVISEGRKTWNLDDAQTIRVAEKTYVIESQARFSGTVPNWRDYLAMEYPRPQAPDEALLPRDREEQKVWKRYLKEGWDSGIHQANKIYESNLAHLKHDMEGMLLYRKLLAQRIVSPPYVAKSNLGVTGGGARLNVNDQVLRITGLPSLQADSEKWDPAIGQ